LAAYVVDPAVRNENDSIRSVALRMYRSHDSSLIWKTFSFGFDGAVHSRPLAALGHVNPVGQKLAHVELSGIFQAPDRHDEQSL
jgi:hypothetical protein